MSESKTFGHGEFIERIAAYLSGGLEGSERTLFEEHRDLCSSCAAELARAQEADAMLAGIFADARPSKPWAGSARQADEGFLPNVGAQMLAGILSSEFFRRLAHPPENCSPRFPSRRSLGQARSARCPPGCAGPVTK